MNQQRYLIYDTASTIHFPVFEFIPTIVKLHTYIHRLPYNQELFITCCEKNCY